jgi:protein tyrosine/serine phosphatase
VTNFLTNARFSEKIRSRRFKHAALGIGLVLLIVTIVLSAYAICTIEQNNFHIVVAGQIYRSAQMNEEDLTHCINKYGIKSVLNLRGENLTTAWHQTEIATAAKLNVVHYDRSLGSGAPLTLEQMDDLVNLLRQAPKPILIHCLGGADRSGLVAALYCYTIDNEKPEQADKQLTMWYGHVSFIRPKVLAMDNSFWRYVSNDTHQIELETSSIK